MNRRILIGFVVLITIALLAGCGGPTSEGLKQRQIAKDRINVLNAQIHFDQAKQSFEVGQFDKALREINQSIALFPQGHSYYVLQGRIYLETKRLEQAIMSFNTVIEKDATQQAKVEPNTSKQTKTAPVLPELPVEPAVLADAHYYAGIVFQRWSDDEQAFENYHRAFELEPTRVDYLLAAAESLIALGRFDEAIALVSDKMAYFEHNAALRQLKGQIALLQGDPRQATKLYAEARLLNPDDLSLLEDLMWAQYAAAQYGQCMDSIRMLQSKLTEPRTDLTHLQARCLTALGRSTEARDIYMELTRTRPSDPTVWIELGTLAWELGDYRRVAQSSVQIIALAPDRYEGYMLKGINERQKNNIDQAISLFKQACKHAGDSALPHMILGQTLEQSGDLASAAMAYQSAVDAEPGNQNAHELLRRAQQSRITAAPVENG